MGKYKYQVMSHSLTGGGVVAVEIENKKSLRTVLQAEGTAKVKPRAQVGKKLAYGKMAKA